MDEPAPTAKSSAARTKEALDKGKAVADAKAKPKGKPKGDDDSRSPHILDMYIS